MSGLSHSQYALDQVKNAVLNWVRPSLEFQQIEWKAPSGNTPLPSLFIFPRSEGGFKHYVGMNSAWSSELWVIIIAPTAEEARELSYSVMARIPSIAILPDPDHSPGWNWSCRPVSTWVQYTVKNTIHLRLILRVTVQPN